MLEIFVSIAIAFGAEQQGPNLMMTQSIVVATENASGIHLEDLNNTHTVRNPNGVVVVKVLTQDQNGGGR
jgi:hypothetical protein